MTVERDGDQWSARYRFAREVPAWAFVRSALIQEQGTPWRPLSWVIDTPGLAWERRDGRDVIAAADGSVPREVRIRFRPAPLTLQADYPPALAFTDGSVALFTDHFLMAPAGQSADAALPRAKLTFRDRRGQVLHQGARYDSASFDGEAGTYILFGPAAPLVSEHLTTVVDPALPAWFRDELLAFLPQTLRRYSDLLGVPNIPGKPMVMMSWGGAGTGGVSQSGSVLPGLIVMALQGSGMSAPNPAVFDRARWFIAHEAAHFWLGQMVRYETARDAWITEGGADLLAIRAVAAADPMYDSRKELQREVDDCVRLTKGRGISSAGQRGEHRAYYACGAVFSLVAEAASGRSFEAWIRGLIAANRSDGVLSRAEWLAAIGNPQIAASIEALLDEGAKEPGTALAQLLTQAKVPHEREGGRLILK
ncbi:MAG TPA: hypothetical protein VEZ70_00490 [Allosphingosinicella sp.]|nr:hypothetical protein [Allosphingosinicella sp.]